MHIRTRTIPMALNKTPTVDLSQIYDVLVIGCGNAALCAAMTAAEAGAQVLMLESAPQEFRGGREIKV